MFVFKINYPKLIQPVEKYHARIAFRVSLTFSNFPENTSMFPEKNFVNKRSANISRYNQVLHLNVAPFLACIIIQTRQKPHLKMTPRHNLKINSSPARVEIQFRTLLTQPRTQKKNTRPRPGRQSPKSRLNN